MIARYCRNRQFLRILFAVIALVFLISLLHNYKIRVGESNSNDELASSKKKQSMNLMVVNASLLEEQNGPNKLENEAAHPRVEAEQDKVADQEDWELENENVPDLSIIMGKDKKGPKQFNPTCAKFPDLFNVQFSNIHWQIQETKQEIYFLYAAFLDLRGQKESPALMGKVRVLAMSDARPLETANATLKMCQFWFSDQQKPVFGNITEVRLVWNIKWGKTGHYYPYLITCQLPQNLTKIPDSVSLVSDKCDYATNNLNIVHKERASQTLEERTPRKNFGVCVKALDYPDAKMSVRLVEWIEMLRILGADKIFLYEYFVDSEIKKILDFYESQGVIDVAQTTLPGELPNQPQLRHLYIRGKKLDKRLTELIPYNDCLYKHMYDYKYVLVVDTDELVIPVDNVTWTGLLDQINTLDIGEEALSKQPMSTYCFKNFYFLDGMMADKTSEVEEIPDAFHMLRHVYRSKESTGTRYMKCFHSTEFTAGVHNHFAFFCKDNKGCKRHYVDIKRAQMNHYRETCVSDIKNCSVYLLDTEKDLTLWRYKDSLISRVQTVLNHVT